MRIGINAMSLISKMKEDFSGTVTALREAGCDDLELMSDWGAKKETIDFYAGLTGGPSGWDPENTLLRLKEMRKKGLDACGMFVFDECLEEQAGALGAYCRDAGLHYVVLSYLEYGDIHEIYKKIDVIRRVAAVLKPYGVQICQHNHEHDVTLIEDLDRTAKPIIDIFLEQLSPSQLMLEVDTGWLLYAGIDPAAYIQNKQDRIMILHLKDIANNYREMEREQIFVPCGKGTVDFPDIFAKLSEEKKHSLLYVIDQDSSCGDILEDHKISLSYLRQFLTENDDGSDGE